MRLSEAIRLGAMKRQQGLGETYDARYDATCVAGAALDGIGELDKIVRMVRVQTRGHVRGLQGVPVRIRQDFPIWVEPALDPPIVLNSSTPSAKRIGSLAVCLNDRYAWTREEIAGWIEHEERLRGLWDEQDEQETTEEVSHVAK
jgi:hypothetical protein